MIRAALAAALLLGLLDARAGAARADEAVLPSVTVGKLAIAIALRPDGSYTLTEHREESPASTAAAAAIGQYPIGFNPTLETLDIARAYTRKPDGREIPVDMAAVRAQLAPGVPDVPIFRDLQQKVLIFPDLDSGDTEVMELRRTVKQPLFPGRFFWQIDFPQTTAWDDVSITITAPAGLPLQSQSFGLTATQQTAGGVTTYAWHYRATEVIAEDRGVVSPWDRLPRLFVSSFPNYRAMAAAYAALAAPAEAVTPSIRRKAAAIIAGIADRRARARAIYDWVSGHVRYVALYLGNGGVVPHAANAVLAAGYGDCKDHVALFTALLRAAGIESQTVLVNLDTAYTLSGPPTLAQLDHAIVYLPEFGIYADTTSGAAPFGVLPFQEYGKPAVLVPPAPIARSAVPAGDEGPPAIAGLAMASGPANAAASAAPPFAADALSGGELPSGRITLPMPAADAATETTRTEAHVDLDGAILGTTTTEATGPFAVALRLSARWVEMAGAQGAARRELANLDEPGSGAFTVDPLEKLTGHYRVTGHFSLDARPEILDGDSFAPPLGLQLLVRPGDYLLGPLRRARLPATEPTPCFPGRQIEDLSLVLPQGRRPERLPPDRAIDDPDFTYRSHWSMVGQTLSVHREFASRVTAPICAGPLRVRAATALALIREDQRRKVILADP
jgi:hypothetical protein